MPELFRCIGFDVAGANDIEHIVRRVIAERPPMVSNPQGSALASHYMSWDFGGGPQLWIALAGGGPMGEPGREIAAVNPYFRGDSRIALTVRGQFSADPANPYRGAVLADFASVDITADYPPSEIVLEVVDYGAIAHQPTPRTATAQVAAFAEWIEAFPDREAVMAAQAPAADAASTDEPWAGLFGAYAFHGLGLDALSHGLDGDECDGPGQEALAATVQRRPPPFAILAGTVLAAESRVNPFTGLTYQWALVQSPGGPIDVVAATYQLEAPLQPGMIVQGSFWMAGQFV